MEDSLKHLEQNQPKETKVVSNASSKFIGKVFLYTAIALAITAVTAAVIGIIFPELSPKSIIRLMRWILN